MGVHNKSQATNMIAGEVAASIKTCSPGIRTNLLKLYRTPASEHNHIEANNGQPTGVAAYTEQIAMMRYHQ
jgi:hypothetical protein